MEQKNETKKYERAIGDLKHAIKFYEQTHGDEPAAFLAVVKAFEVSVEYCWKEFKRQIESKGIEDVFAPKDVIRKSAQIGLIDEAESWLDYIDARNDSVHDYYSMTQAEYLSLAKAFLKDATRAFGL